MTTTISSAMQENQHKALRGLAIALSLIVYVAGLAYAGVRSYTLFSATIDPGLLPLAVLGIVALEVSAIALPLAIHFWTQPGGQRLAAMGFYLLDLALIAGNAILDAAHHSSADVSGVLVGYGVYVVPALPLICMAGWSLVWMLDPSSRERDMRESVKAATHEALLSQIQKAVAQADITQAIENAAGEAARALVGDTLGNVPKRLVSPSFSTATYNAETEATSVVKPTRNGNKAKAEDATPK